MSTDSLAGVVSKVSRFDGDGTLRSYVTLEPLPKSDFVATTGLTEDATANAHVIEMQWRSIDDASNFTDDDTTAQTIQPKKNIITTFSEPPETEDRNEDGATRISAFLVQEIKIWYSGQKKRSAKSVHKFLL